MIHIHINLYAWCFLAGIIVNLAFVYLETKKYNMPSLNGFALVFFEATGMLIGARVLSAVQNGDFSIVKAGVSSLGAPIGALAMVGIYCSIFKISFLQLMCIVILPMPLTYSIGKLGCFTAGCCYGVEYNGVLSVMYESSKSAPPDTPLFPVQLTDAVAFGMLFSVFYLFYKTHEFNIKHVCLYTMLLSAVKGALYYFRNESLSEPFGSHQIICLSLILISLAAYIFVILKEMRKNHEKSKAEL